METKHRVTRDGTVIKDGNPIGSVRKTTEGTSIYSAFTGTPGPTRWIPLDLEGAQITGEWVKKRDAVLMVVLRAEPTTVSGMELKNTGYVGNFAKVWVANVTHGGTRMRVSRYPHEDKWRVNALTPLGAFIPKFCSLAGTRPANLLSSEHCISLLNEVAESAGAVFTPPRS